MVQQVEDPALSLQQLVLLLWCRFDPLPKKLHMPTEGVGAGGGGGGERMGLCSVLFFFFFFFWSFLGPLLRHMEVPRLGV